MLPCRYVRPMAIRNPYYQGPASEHFDGVRFFNPGHESTDRGLGDMLRWKLRERAAKWPKSVPVVGAKPAARVDGLRVTTVGHATLLIQIGGLNLVTDPVFSDRASPLRIAGPRRVTAPGVAFDDLPPIDAVLLSHNHYDHLDIATLQRLESRDHPRIITLLGNDSIIAGRLPHARVSAGDWGQRFDLGNGVDAHIVPALHWSSRTPRDRRMALWGGFVVTSGAQSVYFAGDTGYGDGRIFRDIGARFGPVDLALIPIGAYAPRWFMSVSHVNPEEAVRIMIDLEARRAIGIHWGSFQLTDEPRNEPAALLAVALASHGIEAGRFPAAAPSEVFNAA